MGAHSLWLELGFEGQWARHFLGVSFQGGELLHSVEVCVQR